MSGRVLLISSDDESLDDAASDLVDAGFVVDRCHEPGSAVFPCTGLSGGDCPLAVHGGIDVAVDVRQHPWPNPTGRETGVTCALRASVPVVVVGRRGHPFEPWVIATVRDTDGLSVVVEDAIADALETPRAAVAEAVAAVLAVHDLAGAPFSVRLERRYDRLHATIAVDAPRSVGAMAATRAAVALRRFDRRATTLEIEVVEPSAQR